MGIGRNSAMLLKGIVVKAYNNYYAVQTDKESKIVLCTVRGRLKQARFTLLVGDQVEYTVSSGQKGSIEAILPRASMLKRPMVANVDQVILTFACRHPDFSLQIVDRFLVLAEASQLHSVLCFNKVDLANRQEIEQVAEKYRAIGYPVLIVAAKQNEGIEELRRLLHDHISVFAGPSGVGKSTLLNAIEPGLLLKTGDLSEKIGRGKHTTRHAELLSLFVNGFVVDTPGFSFTEFIDMAEQEVRDCFPEFHELQTPCKFSSCLHDREPQCGVKKAVLQNKICSSRYENYLAILHEIQANKKGYRS
jgi:ribosome biogenesis GTPase / thiamine phosphate phosphatase